MSEKLAEKFFAQGRKAERKAILDQLVDIREDHLKSIKNGRDYDGWRLMAEAIDAAICDIVFTAGGHCPTCNYQHDGKGN